LTSGPCDPFENASTDEVLLHPICRNSSPLTESDHDTTDRLNDALDELTKLSNYLRANTDQIREITERVVTALTAGNTIYFIGNGGAAAEAQHIAAELVGRMRRQRGPLPALALTTDTSILTAISNDWDFDQVFERQVEAHCSSGDIVVGLSGSGNSVNIVKGLAAAKSKGALAVACTGSSPNNMSNIADLTIALPTESTPRAQEMHLMLWHVICEMVDDTMIGDES